MGLNPNHLGGPRPYGARPMPCVGLLFCFGKLLIALPCTLTAAIIDFLKMGTVVLTPQFYLHKGKEALAIVEAAILQLEQIIDRVQIKQAVTTG